MIIECKVLFVRLIQICAAAVIISFYNILCVRGCLCGITAGTFTGIIVSYSHRTYNVVVGSQVVFYKQIITGQNVFDGICFVVFGVSPCHTHRRHHQCGADKRDHQRREHQEYGKVACLIPVCMQDLCDLL